MQLEAVNAYGVQPHDAECLVLRRIYSELMRMANRQLRCEPLGYQWSAAALINETYLRVVAHYGKEWTEHENILALWRRMMGNVLIDHGRTHRAKKRNCGRFEYEITDVNPASPRDLELAVGLALAIERLSVVDYRQAIVFKLLLCDGLTLDEAARVMCVSSRPVKRLVRAARSQLLTSFGGSCRRKTNVPPPGSDEVTNLTRISASAA